MFFHNESLKDDVHMNSPSKDTANSETNTNSKTDAVTGLRALPRVDAVLQHPTICEQIAKHGLGTVTEWVRAECEQLRNDVRNDRITGDRPTLLNELITRLSNKAITVQQTELGSVINATGVILHTGLGRAPLSRASTVRISETAGASNVEIDLETTKRYYRGHQLQPAWKTLTGCEDSLVVNNNAAATLLTLQALGAGREVIISRGQLIEIGGSFRLPEIFELSGVKLREVGTTNRTKLSDYENAIGPETAAIMLVHTSNYRIIGFTTSPGITELTELAHRHNIVSIDDIGSGALIDVARYNLPSEPTFTDSINAGADVVLGSGDKLLGGPQAGIILGKSQFVETIRQHPLARAVRVGKLTLAALSATLNSYLRGTAEEEIPTLQLLAAEPEKLLERANNIRQTILDHIKTSSAKTEIVKIDVREETAPVGGGTLPGVELPTAILAISHNTIPAEEFTKRLRLSSDRLFCRIQQDQLIIDLRSVLADDDSRVISAVCSIINSSK